MIPYAMFAHRAEIRRKGQTIAGLKKLPSETIVVDVVECRIDPAGDAALSSALGQSASDVYTGRFPGRTDLQVGDELTWLDRGTVLRVDGIEERSADMIGDDVLLEVSLTRKAAS